MERQELLRELEQLVSVNNLDADEIRLFILLLTNGIGSRKGEIYFRAIKDAMGREFSRGKLTKACRQLSDCGLIKVTSTIPEATGDEDFILTYIISTAMAN